MEKLKQCYDLRVVKKKSQSLREKNPLKAICSLKTRNCSNL